VGPFLKEKIRSGKRRVLTMLRILLSLKFSDMKETMIGMFSICKTLGLLKGTRVISLSSSKQFHAMISGKGSYREEGKRRIWFKMYFLKVIYEYLNEADIQNANETFEKIIDAPGRAYIGNFAPPARLFTKDFLLNQAWKDFIKTDYNIQVTVDEPVDNSSSLHVTRCFMNDVVRDLDMMPVAELICNCDFHFWKNYHPNVRFSRDKTLLRGDDFCNHTLTWIDSADTR
jgi:hypothetical protein